MCSSPRSAGGRYRFIDFGDAAWPHPFLSVMPLLLESQHRWSVQQDGAALDLTRPDLRRIINSYLREWTDVAELTDLDEIFVHAVRIALLRRSRAVIDNFVRATRADIPDLGPTPWTWLTTHPSTTAQ